MTTEEEIQRHRIVLSEALDPDILMMPFRSQGQLTQHIGLWSVWWSTDPDTPIGMKVVLATTTTTAAAALSSNHLGTLPWIILQLQSIGFNDAIWDEALRTLRPEVDRLAREQDRCAGRIYYDPAQDVHIMRRVKHPEALQGYRVTRIDDAAANESPVVRPVSTLLRNRIQYAVTHNREPQPITCYLENILPRRSIPGQRLKGGESGMMKESDLLAAVGEWRTWIMLGGDQ